MTLEIKTEEDEKRQLKVTVEVPEDRVQSQMRRVARSLGNQVNIPGFRKGKVPYNVLVRRVGEEALRADAIEDMLESIVVETLEKIDVAPFRPPNLDDMEVNPFIVKLTVPLEPVVVLGDYRSIRKEVDSVEVTDEALEEALEHVRSHHQVLEQVDRPAELGDLVTVGGTGTLDEEEGETIWQEDSRDMVLDPERVFPGTPFVDNLVGCSAGEDKEFQFIFPEDFVEEDLAGKNAKFEVTVLNVQDRELPELDDELAQAEGDYETLDELIEELREELLKQAQQQAKADLMDEFIDEVEKAAEVVFPPAVVESELENRLEQFKAQLKQSGWQWKDWLTLEGKTEESLKESWHDDAVNGVTRGLILGKFIEIEKIDVGADDVDARLDKMLESVSENQELRDQLRSVYTQGQGLQTISNDILMEKAQERIQAIVTGNAPDLEELEQEESADEEE